MLRRALLLGDEYTGYKYGQRVKSIELRSLGSRLEALKTGQPLAGIMAVIAPFTARLANPPTLIRMLYLARVFFLHIALKPLLDETSHLHVIFDRRVQTLHRLLRHSSYGWVRSKSPRRSSLCGVWTCGLLPTLWQTTVLGGLAKVHALHACLCSCQLARPARP